MVADTGKAKTQLGWTPRYTSAQTLEAVAGHMGLPPSRDDIVTSHENLNDHRSWLTCVNAEI